MSYRGALRLVPKSLRPQWLAMRLAYAAPRVDIGCAWVPPPVARNCLRAS